MKKLGDFLLPALAKKGLRKETEGALVCYFAEQVSRGHFQPISFSRGILRVSVASSSAAQAVQIDSEQTIKELNKKIGRDTVKTIKITNRS